ncbi:MAG: cytochrome c biogenesis protein CcsA [Gammaproteobacteria bacterium]|nr:cytochrome c biogenesis protein CcsA [Gammaproteobacteria bacterium]
MSIILKYSTILFYALTFVLILGRAHRIADSDQSGKRGAMLLLWFIACALHAIHLYPQTFTKLGLNLTFYNAVSIMLFIISALILILSITKKREFLGLFILPIAVASVALTIFRPETAASTSSLHGLQIHIVTSLFAFSVLTISALQSILLFSQDRHLRKHSVGSITRALPPLHDTEKFLFQTISVGFVLLSVALGSGFLFLENMFEQHLVHKTILSIIAWIVFALLLAGRWQFGWRGQKAMHWTLGGFGFLILAYLGSKFVQELILSGVSSLPIT